MPPQPWQSILRSAGHSDLCEAWSYDPVLIAASLQRQRPWHSKIRLPGEADKEQDDDFCHLESYDLDCVLIVVRMLHSLDLPRNTKYTRSSLLKCVEHNFGWDRRADYQAKGMLVSKLFPDDLGDLRVLRSKLTFENLMKHPGIDKVLFGCEAFALKDPQLLIYHSAPAASSLIESIELGSYEDMTDMNEVKWNGIKTLGETVAEQSFEVGSRGGDGTKTAPKTTRRYCTVPMFIRVAFEPDKDHPRNFNDVRQFRLVAPTLHYEKDQPARETTSDSPYMLCAIVKIDPSNPIDNPAEVRVYDFNAKMILPETASNVDHRDVIERKIKPDSKWTVGDPRFKFMLFYRKLTLVNEAGSLAQESALEYRSPSPVHSFYLPRSGDQLRPSFNRPLQRYAFAFPREKLSLHNGCTRYFTQAPS
ncbi:hypothetical protein F5Y01DRAFT_308517 [Xylaria sp. FL0043]|nr:hypothetical protein F5Y01DRAFT_308517 [Xylaria sp. FL0043]